MEGSITIAMRGVQHGSVQHGSVQHGSVQHSGVLRIAGHRDGLELAYIPKTPIPEGAVLYLICRDGLVSAALNGRGAAYIKGRHEVQGAVLLTGSGAAAKPAAQGVALGAPAPDMAAAMERIRMREYARANAAQKKRAAADADSPTLPEAQPTERRGALAIDMPRAEQATESATAPIVAQRKAVPQNDIVPQAHNMRATAGGAAALGATAQDTTVQDATMQDATVLGHDDDYFRRKQFLELLRANDNAQIVLGNEWETLIFRPPVSRRPAGGQPASGHSAAYEDILRRARELYK